MKLGGLATGLDTDLIITELMNLERQPVNRLEQRQSGYQERLDVWRDVRMRVNNLRNQSEKLTARGTFDSRGVLASSENTVTATATRSADFANYTLNVHSIASAHAVISSAQDSASEALGLAGSIEINGVDIEIGADFSLTRIMNAINGAEAGVKASIIETTLVIESNETGLANAIEVVDDGQVLENLGFLDSEGEWAEGHEVREAADAQFSLNGVPVSRGTNIVDDLIAGVTFELRSETAGPAYIQVVPDAEKAALAVQEFVEQFNSTYEFLRDKSSVEVSGQTVKREVLQGDALIMGLERQLRGTLSSRFSTNYRYDSFASVGISVDRDGWMSFDQEVFIKALETDADEVQALFSAEQRWVPGEIRGRSTLQGIGAETGGDLVLNIDGTSHTVVFAEGAEYTPLQVIQHINDTVGEDVASLNALGRLTIKSNTTKEWIDHHPDAQSSVTVTDISQSLVNVLGLTRGTTGSLRQSEEGIGRATQRLLDTYTASGTGHIARRSGSIQARIEYLDRRISEWERRLEVKEQGLERTFTALETHIAQQNTLAAWLTQQISNMTAMNRGMGGQS